mmetsp:Transcript_120376/g.340613  ORF Transcript_120376/g.340613 Transcript_120376/m.340613 type:complete len:235 (-) Transcript_120376:2836-3540(-)
MFLRSHLRLRRFLHHLLRRNLVAPGLQELVLRSLQAFFGFGPRLRSGADLLSCLLQPLLCHAQPVLHRVPGISRLLSGLFRGAEFRLHLLRFQAAVVQLLSLLFTSEGAVQGGEVAQGDRGPRFEPVLVGAVAERHVYALVAVLLDEQRSRLAEGRICPLEEPFDLVRREVTMLLLRFKGGLRQTHLVHLKPEHLIFDEAAHDEAVRLDLPLLAYAVRAVDGLHVRRRVPSRVQ